MASPLFFDKSEGKLETVRLLTHGRKRKASHRVPVIICTKSP